MVPIGNGFERDPLGEVGDDGGLDGDDGGDGEGAVGGGFVLPLVLSRNAWNQR
jgi:hypothetical protein